MADADILVVAAGPTGLVGADHAGMQWASVAVMGSPPEVGGQVPAMYPEKERCDVAGATPWASPFPGHSTDTARAG